jgi:hypothetical protein
MSNNVIGEGAAGKIVDLGGGWVRKVLKRGFKGMSVADQVKYQNWLAAATKGYTHLYAPAAREHNKSSFDIERISADDPLHFRDRPDAHAEVVKLYKAAYNDGIILNDIEFYEQPDKRIAVVDVDKVCVHNGKGAIQCEFPHNYTLTQLAKQTPFPEELSARIARIFEGRSRSRSKSRGGGRRTRRSRRSV